MKYITTILIGITFLSCSNSKDTTSKADHKNLEIAVNDSFLLKYPLLTWMRKSPVEIGCMLEKEFSYRDTLFNCDYKNYNNNGDPCTNTGEYYEGIKFPSELKSKVSPTIEDLSFDFEHGALREISITFKDSLSKNQIIQMFRLPTNSNNLPNNVQAILMGENIYSHDKPVNPNYTKWLNIVSFDHMGAGDVDCK